MTPDLSSSVTTLSIGNFRTTGTNVKIERLDGTPIKTCETKEGETNHPRYTLLTTNIQLFAFKAQTLAHINELFIMGISSPVKILVRDHTELCTSVQSQSVSTRLHVRAEFQI